jgi:uncharacterized membrane protein
MAPADSLPERILVSLKRRLAARVVPLRTVGTAAWNTPRARAIRRTLARLLDRYPPLAPAPDGLWPRIALGVVGLMALAFTIFFSAYLFAQQDAFQTHAEDLGIMDQAIWNTLHGAPLHQTICNSVTDTNCIGDISRLAIHFEPILFPLSLLYLIAPSPKTLLLVQALIVASGALPAFGLALRRLASPFAGIVFAVIYLLFPALQAAVTYDFHAVTLSAAFLLFALYFMLSRNNVGLIISCLLALSTKEEIVVDVALIGLSIVVLQRRARLGWSLVALSALWLVVELAIMHAASPLGHSPTASRYAQLGGSPLAVGWYLLTHPVEIVRDYLLSPARMFYLRTLLSPLAYLPLFAPLTLLIAVPALAINMLSNTPTMYSGIYHYNAEIVPILVVASIEGVAILAGLGAGAIRRARRAPARLRVISRPAWARRIPPVRAARVVMVALTLLTLLVALRAQREHGYTPLTTGFSWPQASAHTRLADTIIERIPPDASVSAQSDLVPHLSQRRSIYLFPYQMNNADYVFLDVTGNLYPQQLAAQAYTDQVRSLLMGDRHHVVVAEDGYLLLAKRRAQAVTPSDAVGLPTSFYSFTVAAPNAIPHRITIDFGASVQLVGYDVSPAPTLYVNNPYITLTMYWRVDQPPFPGTMIELVFTRADGSAFSSGDFATTFWRPPQTWRAGEVYVTRTWPILITSREAGVLRLGARVLQPVSGGGFAPVTASIKASRAGLPALLDGDTVGVFYDERVIG